MRLAIYLLLGMTGACQPKEEQCRRMNASGVCLDGAQVVAEPQIAQPQGMTAEQMTQLLTLFKSQQGQQLQSVVRPTRI